jgi:MarR family transcriptional regulator, organic hydroperoxide resistance regulator
VSRRIASTRAAELLQVERDIRARLDDRPFDFVAMSAVANLYRTSTTIRNHLERTVLAGYQLSWVAFTVLWVLWIWGEQESSTVADEAGIAKGTLTGVVRTLASRKLVRRTPLASDKRRVNLALTRKGLHLIEELFPEFNAQEMAVMDELSSTEQRDLSALLRRVIHGLDADDAAS